MRSPCALWYWVWGCFDARGGFASPGPGLAPAGEVLSCRAARKYPKKRAPQSATPTLRVGAHLGRDAGGVRALRNSLRATRCAQTTAASQFTTHARLRACHPTSASPQAQPERGWRRHGPSLRSAWTSRRAAPAPARPSAAMARMGLQTPSGRTEERRAWGGRVCRRTHALRALTCRVCLSAARSAQ